MAPRILKILGYLVIIGLIALFLTGMVYQDGDGNVCSIWIIKPHEGDINPYDHYLQNKSLYKVLSTVIERINENRTPIL